LKKALNEKDVDFEEKFYRVFFCLEKSHQKISTKKIDSHSFNFASLKSE